MAIIYKAETGETFTVKDEKPIGGFSQFGIVYAATDKNDGAYVVKVSRNPDYNPRFIAEYEMLKQVAKATGDKYQGEVYTPDPVFLVRADGDDKQAIAMPLYTTTLANHLADNYKSGDSLNAEKWFLHGATTYLKVLDALHDKQQTCADRKYDDFFLLKDEKRVITIDWNVLQPYTDSARITEVKVTARRWIEMTAQRVATEGDLMTAFDDAFWTRPDFTPAVAELGAISVGLRWILVTALANTDPTHFEVLKEQLNHWRMCLDNKTTPDKTILRVTHDGVYNAILADFELRTQQNGATAEKRREAMTAAANYSPTLSAALVNAIETTRSQLSKGNSDSALNVLKAISPTTPEELAVQKRWENGLTIAPKIDINQRSKQRPNLIEVLMTLSRSWKNDSASSLVNVLARLDDLAKSTGDAKDSIQELRQEAQFRLDYLKALDEKDAAKRSEALKTLLQNGGAVLETLPDLRQAIDQHLTGAVSDESVIVNENVSAVKTAYERFVQTLAKLTDWDDGEVVRALREFDLYFDAARTLVLLRAPSGYKSFSEELSAHILVRDFIESLRFERELAVTVETLQQRLPKELFEFAKKSPAVRRPLSVQYSHLEQQAKQVVHQELQSLDDNIQKRTAEATSKLDGKLTEFKQLEGKFQSLAPKVEEKPAPKPAPWMAFLPLGVAALALLVGVFGLLAGMSGTNALNEFTGQLTKTALAIPPEQQTQVALNQAATAAADIANTAAAEAAFVRETEIAAITQTATVATFTPTATPTPTPTDTPTVTPTPPVVPVLIALENSPFYTLPDGTMYAVAGEPQTLTFRVAAADGQSALPENQSLKFNTNAFEGPVPIRDGVVTIQYNPIADASGENVLTLSAADNQQISMTPYQMTVKVVMRTGDISLDPASVEWLDTGMLTVNAAAEAEGNRLQTIRFMNATEHYPVEMKYQILHAPQGVFPKLTLSGQEILPDQVSALLMNADQSLQIQAIEAGLYRLILTDPLAKREIGSVVFAAGYDYVGLPTPVGANRDNYPAFILPNNGRVVFFSDNRYTNCAGAGYKALLIQPRQAGADVPVLLAGYVKPGTPISNQMITLTAEPISASATASKLIEFAHPQSNAACTAYLTDATTVGPMVIDKIETLDVYDGGRTKSAGSGTSQFVYFEAVAPAGLFNDAGQPPTNSAPSTNTSVTAPILTPAAVIATPTPTAGSGGTGTGTGAGGG